MAGQDKRISSGASLAQLAERLARKSRRMMGSNPTGRTNTHRRPYRRLFLLVKFYVILINIINLPIYVYQRQKS